MQYYFCVSKCSDGNKFGTFKPLMSTHLARESYKQWCRQIENTVVYSAIFHGKDLLLKFCKYLRNIKVSRHLSTNCMVGTREITFIKSVSYRTGVLKFLDYPNR